MVQTVPEDQIVPTLLERARVIAADMEAKAAAEGETITDMGPTVVPVTGTAS